MTDNRLYSTEYADLSTLITDIDEGKVDVPVGDVAKQLDSMWKGELITAEDFTRLYDQMTACKRRVSRERYFNRLISMKEGNVL